MVYGLAKMYLQMRVFLYIAQGPLPVAIPLYILNTYLLNTQRNMILFDFM